MPTAAAATEPTRVRAPDAEAARAAPAARTAASTGVRSVFRRGCGFREHGGDPQAKGVGTLDVKGALLEQLEEVALEACMGEAWRAAFEVSLQLRCGTGLSLVLEVVLQCRERLLAVALGWMRSHDSCLGLM